jgi:hypothetical protein
MCASAPGRKPFISRSDSEFCSALTEGSGSLSYSNRAFLWPVADPDSRMMIGDMSWATAAHRAANHDHQMMLGVIAFPMVASPPDSCWQQDRQGLRLWD